MSRDQRTCALGPAKATLSAPADFQLKQMLEILKLKLSKRGIDVACLKVDEPVVTGKNRDDLQEAIAMVKKGGFDLPLQFTNFRD